MGIRRWYRSVVFVVVAALAVAPVACSSDGSDGSSSPTSAPTSTTAAAAPDPEAVDFGTYPVGRRSLTLVDESRETGPNFSVPGSPTRTLETSVWYPAEGDGPSTGDVAEAVVAPTADAPIRSGRYPVVLFAHGYGGKVMDQEAPLSALASAGYVVIAPAFPLSNMDTPGGPNSGDLDNQPADLSFVLDSLTVTPASDDAAAIAEHIDDTRTGVVGHSLGGATALGFAYGDCCKDDRVDAAVIWAGAFALGAPEGASFPDLPVLLIHGDDDQTLSHVTSQDAFDQIDAPRWFVTLKGEGHLVPFYGAVDGQPATRLTMTITKDLLDATLKDDDSALTHLEKAVDRAGPETATLQKADTPT